MGGRGASGAESGGIGWGNNLPSLSGSEKQVSWANDIRRNAIGYLRDIQKRIKSGDQSYDDFGARLTQRGFNRVNAEMKSTFSEETSAKYFIDNRSFFTAKGIEKTVRLEDDE